MALRANNIDARVVDTGEEARRLILELVPEGAECTQAGRRRSWMSGCSKTYSSRDASTPSGAVHEDGPPNAGT